MAQAVSEDSEDQSVQTHQMVEFRLGDENYVINVSDVSGTNEMKELTRVPRSAESIAGITDVRGEITVVIDPRTLLNKSEADSDEEARLLLLDDSVDSQKVGLRVDSVIGVRSYDDDHIDTEDDVRELELPGFESGLLQGVIRLEDGEEETGTGEQDVETDEPRLRGWLNVEEIIEQSEVSPHEQ